MYKYQTDDNILDLSHKIERSVLRLRPDYLEIEQLADALNHKGTQK